MTDILLSTLRMMLTVAAVNIAMFSGTLAASGKSMGHAPLQQQGMLHHVVGRPKADDRHTASVAKTTGRASMFALEAAMSGSKLISRWNPFINEASKRTGLPRDWICAVLIEESGGRTMMAEDKPIKSSAGAIGLMQLMPDTWRDMQTIYKLGFDPDNPRDNILAGATYLRTLYWEYGYPGMFAAYNDGPGMIEAHRRLKQQLPRETRNYVLDIAAILRTGKRGGLRYAVLLPTPAVPLDRNEPEADVTPAQLQYADDNDDDYYREQAPL